MPTLNIKDPDVYRMAAELAISRGTTLTGAVREALVEALERREVRRQEIMTAIKEIQAQVAAIGYDDMLTDDDLYDEWGLPK